MLFTNVICCPSPFASFAGRSSMTTLESSRPHKIAVGCLVWRTQKSVQQISLPCFLYVNGVRAGAKPCCTLFPTSPKKKVIFWSLSASNVGGHCVAQGLMTTVHAMTATQLTVDGPSRGGKDLPFAPLLVKFHENSTIDRPRCVCEKTRLQQ